ncbi:probable E3 ubiquitin-protein ligase HECTD4 isoform X4 [Lytechinus variegatus]|uniref:probable E3 ubiquitin-protein ligase HECTD4 isoform X4 n=1 Tax=Lytechinus variegatus TaxID=7654 RepID=UPI001BB16539|nr:probable E3 ubiquitin-protein ligase HECTD4 isoform X4 [Lytechinus variegatus]
MASNCVTDTTQWLSVNEESLFLHDGLLRVSDLVNLPKHLNNANPQNSSDEVVSFDTKNPTELSQRLVSVCERHNNIYAYSRLLEYRLNALKGLWNAHLQINSNVEQLERETFGEEEVTNAAGIGGLSLLKKVAWHGAEPAAFSSRLGLLLLFPLLRSQQRINPELSSETAVLLLNCLRDCLPLSLSKEPTDCLDGLENLLSSWLGESDEIDVIARVKPHEEQHALQQQRQQLASALVAFACARGSTGTFIHTTHLLQQLAPSIGPLPIADILQRLLRLEGGPGSPSYLHGSRHVVCWGFEDMLGEKEEKTEDKEKEKESITGRSLACDGVSLYCTNSRGKGLAKIGSGLHGTLRGFVYARNPDLPVGLIACTDKILLHRPLEADSKTDLLGSVINRDTLKVEGNVKMPETLVNASQVTVSLCSDGTYFYRVWCPPGPDKSGKGQPVTVDFLILKEQDGETIADRLRPSIVLVRNEDIVRGVADPLLLRLRAFRPGNAAALAQLTNSNGNSGGREEISTTSCGLTLKLLRRSPIYCCGSSIVIVTSPPGGSSSSASRSLFSTTAGLSGLRTLATSICFNLSNGLLTSKLELMDAPACAIARGSNVQGLGICYDELNNTIWTCSPDWVDQWQNPGLRATHHVCKQLGVPQPPLIEKTPQDNMLEVSEVVGLLLHHVGSSSCHKVHSEVYQSPALGRLMAAPTPPPITHLRRLCAIIEKAVEEQNLAIIQCMLVVLQVVFKSHAFNPDNVDERNILERTRKLVWGLLTSSDGKFGAERLITEACNVIKTGLSVLFSGCDQINGLLRQLLTDGDSTSSLGKLRDMILTELAHQLRQTSRKENHKFDEGLVQMIMNISERESRQLLTQCLTSDRPAESISANVPLASPCQQFLTSLELHILQGIIMNDEKMEEGTSATTPPTGPKPCTKEVEDTVLKLATKIFNGCEQILETLLGMCNDLMNSGQASQMQVLDRVVKGTILGYLLPGLVTALRHPNLRSLDLAEALVPQVVRLTVLISQVAMAIGNTAHQEKKMDKNSSQPHDVVTDLLASHIKDKSEKSCENYLTKLRIPAPWAAGKTVETIHPVRDNYKFRETVHIPGARCLYLRFEPRCASQYDYDKVVIYAGPNTNSRKVVEYGGNTYGYGSRSVLGSGWPKDLVKVEGDTVTFNFEMRSGREHNTPDKALWGFSCTVRAQESSEDCTSGLPFVADLALGLTVLGSSLLKVLYEGPEVTGAEERCHALLSSKMIQRCAWHEMVQQPITGPSSGSKEKGSGTSLPRLKLSKDTLQRLRVMSGRAAPFMRSSIKDVINPVVLEEALVSAAIKLLDLEPMLNSLSSSESGLTAGSPGQNGFIKMIAEVFNRVNTLERQLMFIGELEQRWEREQEEMKAEVDDSQPFFIDYHLQEDKKKDIETLCFILDIDCETISAEEAVKLLRDRMKESRPEEDESQKMTKTKGLVAAILERANALLDVSIPRENGSSSIGRSISHGGDELGNGGVSSQPSTSTNQFSRSLSMPADLTKARPASSDKSSSRPYQMRRSRSSAYSGTPERNQNLNNLLDEIFAFIGTKLNQTVSRDEFLSAVKARHQRGWSRQQALVHAHRLMTTAGRSEGYAHLVTAITSVLQQGPRIDDLKCGGFVETVRQAFSDAMTAIVQLATHHPTDCAYSIGLLCTIPYTRSEEKCLVDSQLVSLLDRLCSLGHSSGQPSRPESQSSGQRVSALAWAGFQVLANRCVSWETDEVSQDALGYAGLARQVSLLLTNHLARATESCGNEAAGSEALQEVLSLLNNLSRSRMGRAILSQPACVSKLLSLLLDQRPSPKLVLIILQLCRVALPLMSAQDCAHVQLPAWGAELASAAGGEGGVTTSDPPARIASLLLAKLGDCVVPGCQTILAPEQLGHLSSVSFIPDREDDLEDQDGRLSVFLHKREDQSSREVIQALLSSEGRPFRLGSGANMEKVLRMDRNMHTNGKAELFTEDAATAIQKAGKLAQAGFLVSVGAPTETTDSENNNKEKLKVTAEAVCREKNAELARTDPVRPFISGHVAHSMASEVIALMHSLLTAPESNTAKIWASAVERVLSHALCQVPLLVSQQSSHMTLLASQPQGPDIEKLLSTCRQVVAAFCALGGFQDCVKMGSTAQIVGDGCVPLEAHVLSLAEHQGIASVSVKADDIPKISNPMDVSISRLIPPKNIVLPLQQLSITEKLVTALHSLLLPQDGQGVCPMLVPLPAEDDGNSQAMATCRVLAEISSRACAVLAHHMGDSNFASEFVMQTNRPLEVLKSLSQQCGTGERQKVVVAQCEKLRMLYRDCARPPTPPAKQNISSVHDMTLDPSRSYPPIKACLFSRCMTSLTFLGDPVTSGGLPAGVMCYATQSVPQQATSFYWELEICSYGDAAEDSGPNVSMGLAPPAEKKDGANNWTNPIGTVLFPVSGHAIHYSGASLLRWKSVRLDITLKVGDVIGMGWQQNDDPSPMNGSGGAGHIFMTLNGHKFAPTLEEVSGGLWPVVHVQKKNTQVRVNFGNRPFAYVDGHCHHTAALESSDSLEEITANFGALPFAMMGESDSDKEPTPPSTPSTEQASPMISTAPGISFKLATPQKPKKDYDVTESQLYSLPGVYADFTTSGLSPHQTALSSAQDDSDEEERDGDGQQDHVSLLVRAWELKVFPVIRRRFRNEAERRSGLEQIKGALQLGMTDIARQTVEFLYEENGGIPRDLHLPTIDDVKQEAAKFTIDKVRKGTTVLIRPLGEESTGTAGGMLVPKYAIRSMLKTLGLSGVVLDVDTQHELVQVESYLRSEGVLVRYWYPLDMLERPLSGMRRVSSSLTGTTSIDISNIQLHRELLQLESSLARLYCRTALTKFLSHCQSPEVIEAIPCSLSPPLTEQHPSASPLAANGGARQHISHLQLLSNQLLTSSQQNGQLHEPSLLTSCGVGHSLAPIITRSLTAIFYGAEELPFLKKELAISIATAAQQGERHLLELTNQICGIFQDPCSAFDVESIKIGEKINNNYFFKNAVGLVVSCKRDIPSSHRESSLYQAPWARVSCYGMGQRVKKSGSVAPLEVVSYPADVTLNNSGGLAAPSSHIVDPYPSVVLPCNKIHVKAGVSPAPNYVMTIHGLPAEFPLAMAFVESLIGCRQEMGEQRVDRHASVTLRPVAESVGEREGILKKPRKISTIVYIRVLELLSGYVGWAAVPAVIKEHLFLVMAQVLRLIRKVDDEDGASASPITMVPLSVLAELRRFRSELGKLFDEEALLAVIGSGSVAPGQHTSYFQALMELCLAMSEIDQFPSAPQTGSSSISVTVTLPSPRPASMVSPKQLVRSSPQVTSRKRRPKMKRAGQQKRTPHNSESDSGEASSNGANNPEDMLWFHRASTLNVILRYLDSQDPQGESSMRTAIRDAHHSVTTPTAYSRLVVISGLPPNMEEPAARRAILKACNQAGGLFKDEIWIPIQEEVKPPTAIDADPKSEQSQVSELTESDPPVQGASDQTQEEISAAAEQQEPERTTESDTPTSLPVDQDTNQCEASSTEASSEPKPSSKKNFVQGYAVIEVRSKAKVEDIEHALLNSRILEDSLPFDNDSMMSVTGEDVLTIATVTPSLLTEPSEMEALVGYLKHKLLPHETSEQLSLGEQSSAALEDIFNSCVRCSHFKSKPSQDSDAAQPEICLSKEQILSTCPGNLLFEFFTTMHPSKMTVEEFVCDIIQKYGVLLPDIKEKKTVTKPGKDGSKGSGKRPSKTMSKERYSPEFTSPKGKPPFAAERKVKVVDKRSGLKDMSSKEKALMEETSCQKKVLKKGLNLHGLLCMGLDRATEDVCSLWRSLLATGFDIHFERTRYEDPNKALASQHSWTNHQDQALVQYTNELCLKLAITPARLHPHELIFSEADLARPEYSCLTGIPIATIRLRYAFLQSLNTNLEHHFLPLVDLRPSQSLVESTAALLSRTREWLFYDTKVRFFNLLLDATAQRNVDTAAPEVSLDPLQVIGTSTKDKSPTFCQAASALANVYSSQLCVKIASGGDPTYAFNVKLVGEEVHGTSGSFRHFLGEVTQELHSDRLRLLMPCLSGCAQDKYRGRYILRPDPMTYPEERMLIFFGQLLGIAMRADIPLALDLLPSFWKCLVQEPLDPDQDLAQADSATHKFLQRMDQAQNEEEFSAVCSDIVAAYLHPDQDALSSPGASCAGMNLHFEYPNMMGDLVELCPNGHEIPVRWGNRQEYIAAVRDLRLRELACPERMLAIRCGLASIVPHRLLTIMNPVDMELRMCGRPHVDLAMLKAHTMYQVGLVETDTHIEFFWQALDSFSQEELSRFIKFACNQERIPSTCPCRQGGNEAAHVPPYPMKIAPPDGPSGSPDQRFIRVETCMFMIKLPQYSTLAVMKEKLLYAINCREDPLSG